MYLYFDEDFNRVGQSKGNRVESVEFYEGSNRMIKLRGTPFFIPFLKEIIDL